MASCVGLILSRTHPVAREQLVQHVEHRDGRDIPRAQDESDPAAAGGMQLGESGRRPRLGSRDPGFEPHLAGVARDEDGVLGVQRKSVRPQATAGCGIQLHAVERTAASRQGLQTLPVCLHGNERGVRSGQPFLSPTRMPGPETCREGSGLGPFLGVGRRRRVQALQQPRALPQCEVHPRSRTRAQVGDRGIELLAFRLRQRRGAGGTLRGGRVRGC